MHMSFLSLLFLTIKAMEEDRREKCLPICGLCMVKKMIVKRSSKDLVPKTRNYHDWKLEVLLGSGGVGGVLFNVLLCGVEHYCRSVKWVTSPWYLLVFMFTMSSMHCLLSSTSSSNLEMKWITLIWERHGKRKVVREKDNKKNTWKKGCERETLRKKKAMRGKTWQHKKNVTKEEREKQKRNGGSKKNEETRSEWKGDATLTTVLTSSFI